LVPVGAKARPSRFHPTRSRPLIATTRSQTSGARSMRESDFGEHGVYDLRTVLEKKRGRTP